MAAQLVASRAVLSSTELVMRKEAIETETWVLTRATRRHIPKDIFQVTECSYEVVMCANDRLVFLSSAVHFWDMPMLTFLRYLSF
jgi:hypothetical protein